MVKSLVIWVIRVPWQSKQNGAAVDVSAEIVSYSHFYWKKYDCNWVTKLHSRYYCNMSHIRPRLIRCHWSFDPRWVKISGHSEQLGPCGSTSHFVNNRHSKVKTRGASCIGGFGQTDGQRKFELGIPQSRGGSYIRGASYIRDKTVAQMITNMRGCVAYNDLWPWPLSSRSFGLGLENLVRSVASTVLDGFFPYLIQMITSMRRCVACDDLWPWPISSRSFDLDFENSVRSVTFSILDRLFPYVPQIITTIRGCVAC